jgi:hypothetical protein
VCRTPPVHIRIPLSASLNPTFVGNACPDLVQIACSRESKVLPVWSASQLQSVIQTSVYYQRVTSPNLHVYRTTVQPSLSKSPNYYMYSKQARVRARFYSTTTAFLFLFLCLFRKNQQIIKKTILKSPFELRPATSPRYFQDTKPPH